MCNYIHYKGQIIKSGAWKGIIILIPLNSNLGQTVSTNNTLIGC